MTNQALVKIDEAKRAIAEAKAITDVLEIRDRAMAAHAYAAAKNYQEAATIAKEAQLRAERRAGEFLAEEVKPGRPIENGDIVSPLKLDDLGIAKKQSSRWQSIASVPELEFEQYIADRQRRGSELTQTGLLRLARQQANTKTPELPEGKYRVFYADPPWKYGNTMPEYFTDQADHYSLMTITELCELPVQELALDDAVLFLWVTSPILEEAFEVIKAWGFKYKTSFVWDKIKHNMGHYNSVRHEFLLVCTRGSCQPDVKKLFDSVQSIERGQHSEKPEAFREIINTIYPEGNRIELFARRQADGWKYFGNEITA